MPEYSDSSIDIEKFVFDARPDTVDFRDRMYEPTLVEVPTHINLGDYQAHQAPVLYQGHEGACTGFGLATMAGYLLRKRETVPDSTPVSARMFYEMAKRYDEWPGESYQGSSARGAMKGWHKHGVCSDEVWPYEPHTEDWTLTHERAADAAHRPLGAYLRVNHKDLVAMHSALAEVGILFATAWVHDGWVAASADGLIPFSSDIRVLGGHAFALVAYDQRGFWIQNSWGEDWGKGGFAHISYDDWLVNGLDVWVARLGVPVSLRVESSTAANIAPGATRTKSYAFSELRPHIITIGENGRLSSENTYGTQDADIAAIFHEDIPRITQGWDKKRILLYANGGLVSDRAFTQRVAEYRAAMLPAQIYPLAFSWYSDFWSTVNNLLQEAIRHRKPEGTLRLSSDLDFMLDRLDDTLEPLVRSLGGKSQWDELKKRALSPTLAPDGGVRITLKYLAELLKTEPDTEIHLVAHSAGSIFFSPLVRLLTTDGKVKSGFMRGAEGFGAQIHSIILWAPAIRITDFKRAYMPAIRTGGIHSCTLYTLTDEAERDDHCAHIYNKSLLYLVSNALEGQRNEPLLGMEQHSQKDPKIKQLIKNKTLEWVRAPNSAAESSKWSSKARGHGDFDDDAFTLRSSTIRILQSWQGLPEYSFQTSQSSLQEQRAQLDNLMD